MNALHPNRYPKHEGDKGQVYDGECNITRCTNHEAVYWNMGTFGLYCASCAHQINWNPYRPPICILVDEKPASVEAMEQFKRDNRYYEAVA